MRIGCHGGRRTSDWQAWQRTAWSCVTCLEVAENGQALEFVSEELRGERESLSPRSSSELEAGEKDLEAPQCSGRTEFLQQCVDNCGLALLRGYTAFHNMREREGLAQAPFG
ncbi:unnamed protein product [Effrenium voratum]|nr:unnamed protein product [Effrenium voratum]